MCVCVCVCVCVIKRTHGEKIRTFFKNKIKPKLRNQQLKVISC